jgi:hypothetical protein
MGGASAKPPRRSQPRPRRAGEKHLLGERATPVLTLVRRQGENLGELPPGIADQNLCLAPPGRHHDAQVR